MSKNWWGEYLITAESFVESGNSADNFNDTLESYKCGDETGAIFCQGEFTKESILDNYNRFLFNAYKC